MRSLIYSVIILGISYSAWASEPGISPQAGEIYRVEALKCGRNSLFMFLILSGHPEVTMDELASLSGTEEGVSLSSICEMAKRHNVNAEVRHYSPGEAGSIPLPAIIQLDFGGPDPSIRTLHFVVLYRVNSDEGLVLDGTTGFKEQISAAKLTQLWTGYAMVERRSVFSRLIKGHTAWVLIGFLLVTNGVVVWSRVRQIKIDSGEKLPRGRREIPV
ncbi:MAG TPA: cysteine peptidase family C39 domain-containing protein [Verrucomicrobiae bacterium]|nr:cysteine peptidase family C39 domain-containing protein [Verrucomicrobiae bacterium]